MKTGWRPARKITDGRGKTYKFGGHWIYRFAGRTDFLPNEEPTELIEDRLEYEKGDFPNDDLREKKNEQSTIPFKRLKAAQ